MPYTQRLDHFIRNSHMISHLRNIEIRGIRPAFTDWQMGQVHQQIKQSKPIQYDPTQKQTAMNKDITSEIISDEQLEEVAGGLADVENNSCVALYQATAQINL
jgi:hypothetical protein